jgi:hypothetical protein
MGSPLDDPTAEWAFLEVERQYRLLEHLMLENVQQAGRMGDLCRELAAAKVAIERVEEALRKSGGWYSVRFGGQDVPVIPVPAIRAALDSTD